MWPNPHFPADLVIITEEILNGKLHFLCSVSCRNRPLEFCTIFKYLENFTLLLILSKDIEINPGLIEQVVTAVLLIKETKVSDKQQGQNAWAMPYVYDALLDLVAFVQFGGVLLLVKL